MSEDGHGGTAEERSPGGVSRRGLLAGAAALAGGHVLLRAGTAEASRPPLEGDAKPVGAAPPPPPAARPWKHAAGDERGITVAAKKGRAVEGRFGVMFKDLPAHSPPDDLLRALAGRMGEPASADPFDLDNPAITAGYTFLGQFIDHDMTLDRTPLAQQRSDPDALVNYDSPSFDLGSLYGRGPAADPDLYEPGGAGRLRVVVNAEGVEDLPRRADGTAWIGDGRNDENLIVSQLHLAFAKFHNRCLASGLAGSFADAQRLVRWHFQWLIVHEFLPRVVGDDVVRRFLPDPAKPTVKREFYKPKDPTRPMMPVEYSVAAYRFGHSMVRAAYLVNIVDGVNTVAPTFGQEGADLRGSRPLPARVRIDWEHFFAVPGRPEDHVNHARRIDGKLALPLFNLPSTVVSDAVVSLAERNLLRAKQCGLPSGQAVARAMGVTPLTNAELGVPDPADPGWAGGAPLWFYVLREAELQRGGQRLGEVGGRVVAEVILGVLDSDKTSYLHAKTPFRPVPPLAVTASEFRVGDLIAYAQGA